MNSQQHWTASAACANRRDLPWTSDAADVTPWQAETMRVICRSCPVLLDCLAAVDELHVTGGWWAGADRDPHTAQATPATVAAATAATAPGTDTLAISSPVMCWQPRQRAGHTLSQGAYVLERDTAGAWHLGGVTSPWDDTSTAGTSGTAGDATSGAGAA